MTITEIINEVYGSQDNFDTFRKSILNMNLEGSVKQITWAKEIIRVWYKNHLKIYYPHDWAIAKFYIDHHREAKHYIENRDTISYLIDREIYEAYEGLENQEDEVKIARRAI